MSKKSLTKSSPTGPTLDPHELFAIVGKQNDPGMLAALIGKHYCWRIQSVGKCQLPCRTNPVCVKNISTMMMKLAEARKPAALLVYICRDLGEKEIESEVTQFEYKVDDFGRKSGDVLDWDQILGQGEKLC